MNVDEGPSHKISPPADHPLIFMRWQRRNVGPFPRQLSLKSSSIWILINRFLLEHKGRMRGNFNYTSGLSFRTVPFLLHNSDRPRQLLKAILLRLLASNYLCLAPLNHTYRSTSYTSQMPGRSHRTVSLKVTSPRLPHSFPTILQPQLPHCADTGSPSRYLPMEVVVCSLSSDHSSVVSILAALV